MGILRSRDVGFMMGQVDLLLLEVWVWLRGFALVSGVGVLWLDCVVWGLFVGICGCCVKASGVNLGRFGCVGLIGISFGFLFGGFLFASFWIGVLQFRLPSFVVCLVFVFRSWLGWVAFVVDWICLGCVYDFGLWWSANIWI